MTQNQTVEQFKHANQFLIYTQQEIGGCNKETVTFQSYKTPIATWHRYENVLVLKGDMWDYSNTTRKHFKLFINKCTNLKYEDKAQWLKESAQNPQVVTE